MALNSVEYGFFDPRGPFFRFLEDIPLLGYYIAGIDAMAGDEDEAKRAAAECTYSTMVLAASIAGGTLGGPLGAALGSAIATVAGKYVEAAIAETIEDPTLRAPLTGVSIYNILVSEVFIIAGVGIGEISSQFGQLLTDELTEEGFSELFSKMAGQLGKKGLNKLTKEELKLIVDTVIKAVQEGHDSDWVAKQLGFQPPVRLPSPNENPSGPPGHDPWKIGRI
ncbi:hypothetical protein BJX68DRAFT_249659 [Aspergillus pseudodeflectus]|uniref:Uncharacterized protein n=1 Tax=Aspergillus pseudodeflectus TaxID=176178 RepID=A0ABR4JC31_9EURO